MKRELAASLREVVALSDRMIELSKSGAEAGGGVECGIIFGTLRDCGYKLKRAATEELEKAGLAAGAQPDAADDEKSSAGVPSTSTEEEGGNAMESARSDRRKVLIVDDEKDVVTYLKTWFEDRPALITLDMSMPEKSGVRVYREIKEATDFQDIPVIIITAIGEPMRSFLDRTKQVPAPDGFIAKPIELTDLASLVKQLVN